MDTEPQHFDVLYVLNSLAIGGSERKTVRAANGLVARGKIVGVVCLNGPDTLRSTLDPRVRVWYLDRRGKFSFAAVARLRQIAIATHARSLLAVNLYPALYVAAASRWLHPRPRTVCLINTSADAPGLDWRLRRPLYKGVLRAFDLAVHGCEAYRRLWAAPGSRAWEHSRVLYNGVDLEEFAPETLAQTQADARLQYGIPPERFVIGMVGRLSAEKNPGVLLDTVARLRTSNIDAHVLFVGDGPLRPILERRVKALELRKRVTFAGAITDVRPALKAMDVFVLPSVGVETFSNAVLEAMAMGKPIILSGIGGAAEMLDHGVEGFIVPPQEMSTRLPGLLDQLYADPRRRAAMGAAGRARVDARFSLKHFLDGHLALIEAGA